MYFLSCILSPTMLSLLLLHLVLALVAIAGRSRLGRHAFALGALGPLALLGWVAIRAGDITGGTPHLESIRWVPGLDLVVDLRVDAYTLIFLVVIGVAGTGIFLYAARYFASSPRVGMFAGTMILFGGAMTGLVTADHLLATFVFWELTTITSYLLIGYDDHLAAARSAALHAALVTGAGGLAMLGGMVLLGGEAGTFALPSSWRTHRPPRPGGRRMGADPGGGGHQVGSVPVPWLAARGDGCPHPGQRLPPLRHHGQGGDLPRWTPGARSLVERPSGSRPC